MNVQRTVSVTAVEDVMTPRSLLSTVGIHELGKAQYQADEGDFDAIPVVDGGEIVGYWWRDTRRMKRITPEHRVDHATEVPLLLARLVKLGVQFVTYRSQVVGLIDLSDMNRPLARLALLHPALQCEQSIFDAARAMHLTDEQEAAALGDVAALAARRKRRKAKRENLNAPLLEFAGFGEVLRAARKLGIIGEIRDEDVQRLKRVRDRLAHGVRRVIEQRGDGEDLVWAQAAFHALLVQLKAV